MNSVANDMNTTIDRDDEETILQSSHREWAEDWGLAQQRYAKSHRIFANSLGVKDFRPIRNSHDGTCFRRLILGA
jgi:hypothetical protein